MTYSARFLEMWPWLMDWEGRAYENDPDDPGGATKFGIDQRSHPRENIRTLTEERAKEIYWVEYWQKNGCEARSAPKGEVVFNCAVNAGIGRANKIMAAGANSASEFMTALENFYRNLAAARPRSAKFLKGWLNRCRSLRQKYRIQ